MAHVFMFDDKARDRRGKCIHGGSHAKPTKFGDLESGHTYNPADTHPGPKMQGVHKGPANRIYMKSNGLALPSINPEKAKK